jgi:hypothetical protein
VPWTRHDQSFPDAIPSKYYLFAKKCPVQRIYVVWNLNFLVVWNLNFLVRQFISHKNCQKKGGNNQFHFDLKSIHSDNLSKKSQWWNFTLSYKSGGRIICKNEKKTRTVSTLWWMSDACLQANLEDKIARDIFSTGQSQPSWLFVSSPNLHMKTQCWGDRPIKLSAF